jgi:glycine cleavage system H protein
MSNNVPEGLRYTKSHEWVKLESNGNCTIGITDHAQGMLGDIVFVDLPDVDKGVAAEEECCTIESVKAATDTYSPIAGTVVEVNTKLESSPSLVNGDPYGEGWLFKIKPKNADDINKLMTPEEYKKFEEE